MQSIFKFYNFMAFFLVRVCVGGKIQDPGSNEDSHLVISFRLISLNPEEFSVLSLVTDIFEEYKSMDFQNVLNLGLFSHN